MHTYINKKHKNIHMDLHDRVMEILDGRIKMGAAKPKKRVKKYRKEPIISRVPPSRKVPNSSKGQRTTKLADQYVGQEPWVPMSSLEHHYPTEVPGLTVEPQDPQVMKMLEEMVQPADPVKASGMKKKRATKKAGNLSDLEEDYIFVYHPIVRDNYGYNPPYPKTDEEKRKFIKVASILTDTTPKQHTELYEGNIYDESGMDVRPGKRGRNYGGVRAGVKAGAKKKSAWIQHVKMTQKQHPGMSYKDAMKVASKTYKKPAAARKTKASKAKPKRVHRKSEWIDYVKEYARLNGLSYRDAMKEAAPSYHAQG